MSEASHTRLVQILGDLEMRCAKYKRTPLDAAQQWANENWSLSESPLIEVVEAGVRYCQLHSMGQTIGFDLNKLGARVCSLLDMHLTERVAGVELFDAIFALREFAHRVRTEIEWPAEGKKHKGNGDAQSNGHAETNNNNPAADGPVEGYRWRHNGKVTSDTMQPKAWKMARFLWTKPTRTADFADLSLPVYDKHSHGVTEDAIGSFRKQANSFFSRHGIPLVVSIKQGTVTLEMPSAADLPQVAQ